MPGPSMRESLRKQTKVSCRTGSGWKGERQAQPRPWECPQMPRRNLSPQRFDSSPWQHGALSELSSMIFLPSSKALSFSESLLSSTEHDQRQTSRKWETQLAPINPLGLIQAPLWEVFLPWLILSFSLCPSLWVVPHSRGAVCIVGSLMNMCWMKGSLQVDCPQSRLPDPASLCLEFSLFIWWVYFNTRGLLDVMYPCLLSSRVTSSRKSLTFPLKVFFLSMAIAPRGTSQLLDQDSPWATRTRPDSFHCGHLLKVLGLGDTCRRYHL